MKTLLTPSLIVLACFSGFTVAATSLSAQHSSDSQLQLTTQPMAMAGSNANANVSNNQQSQVQLTAEQPESEPVATANSNAESTTGSSLQLNGPQDPQAMDDLALPAIGLTENASLLSNTLADVNAAGTAATVSAAQQISSNVAANANQAAELTNTVQQQILGSANQALQQDASASVAQSVSQAVTAEVSNTVRNSITLATGL